MVQTMLNRFLVYGTLRVGQGAYYSFGLDDKTTHLGQVRVPGSIYHMGGFPGLVLDGDEEGVLCDVLEVADEDAVADVLYALDGYEGYRKDIPANSLYLRRVVKTPEFGPAWVYEINCGVGGRPRIEGGDWLDAGGL